MRLALLKRFFVGAPMSLAQARHERLGNAVALAIFASDPLSSVAYATEEILHVLVLAGSAALSYSLPIGVAIAALLAIVVTSYRQTVAAYPQGGGAYVVARENLGQTPGPRGRGRAPDRLRPHRVRLGRRRRCRHHLRLPALPALPRPPRDPRRGGHHPREPPRATRVRPDLRRSRRTSSWRDARHDRLWAGGGVARPPARGALCAPPSRASRASASSSSCAPSPPAAPR